MKWFKNPQSLEELKKQYRELAMQNHPDRGGKTSDMQAINAEYDNLFKRLKDVHQTVDGKTYTKATDETPDEFKEIIEKLIHLDGIHIEICGSWIWVTGNTYPHRNTFKSLRFKWSKSKSAWYYKRDDYHKATRRTFTLDEIRDLYGSTEIKNNPPLKIAVV